MCDPQWPTEPGAYLLLVKVVVPLELTIGRLGQSVTPPGVYAYAGSAQGPGGLHGRITRHLRREKRRHWHIDYLTEHAPVVLVLFAEGKERQECAWAQKMLALPGARATIPHFGSSDCRLGCAAHLVRLPDNVTARELCDILDLSAVIDPDR